MTFCEFSKILLYKSSIPGGPAPWFRRPCLYVQFSVLIRFFSCLLTFFCRFGRFVYKDRQNNKKWDLTRQSKYPGPEGVRGYWNMFPNSSQKVLQAFGWFAILVLIFAITKILHKSINYIGIHCSVENCFKVIWTFCVCCNGQNTITYSLVESRWKSITYLVMLGIVIG